MKRMIQNAKRALTGLLAAAMVVTALPSYAMADVLPDDPVAIEETTLLNEAGQDEQSVVSTETPETETTYESTVEESEEQSVTDVASEEETTEALSEDETLSDDADMDEENTEDVSDAVTEASTEEQEMLGAEEQVKVTFILEGCSLDSSSLENLNLVNGEYYLNKNAGSFSFALKPDEGLLPFYTLVYYENDFGHWLPYKMNGDVLTIYPQEGESSFESDIAVESEFHDPKSPGYRKVEFDYDPAQVDLGILAYINTDTIVTEVRSTVIDVLPKKGFMIESVKIGEEMLRFMGEDSYIIPEGTEDFTVTIKSRPVNSVPVKCTVDGEDYNSETSHSSFSVDGLTDDGKTDGKAIVINTNPEDGYEIAKVTYSAGNSINGEAVLTSANKYTIAADVVTELADASENIVIDIVTKRGNTNAVTVEYKTDHVAAVKAFSDGRYIENISAEDGKAKFKVDTGKQLTLRAIPKEHYKLTGARVNDADVTLSSNGEFTVNADKDMSVEILSTGIVTMYYSTFSSNAREVKSGSTITLPYDEYASVYISEGKSDDERLEVNVDSKVENKADTFGFAEYTDGHSIKLYPFNIPGKTAKLTLTGKDSSGAPFTMTLNIKVTAKPETLTLSRFKKNTYEIEQTVGTSVQYSVTTNKGADRDYITAHISKTSDKNATIRFDKNAMTITVNMFSGGASRTLPSEDIIVEFKGLGDTHLATYTFKPAEIKSLAAPTVKVVGTDDVSMTLTLNVPKAVKEVKNLYFKIDAKASTKPVASGMKEEIDTVYVPYDPEAGAVTKKIVLANNNTMGQGAAQKYDVAVSIIQLKSDLEETDENKYESSNIITTGAAKTLSKQSTKDPYYETKLSLVKKRTTVTDGEKDVILAKVKYSKQTSYSSIRYVELKDSAEYTVADGANFHPNNDSTEVILRDFNKFNYIYPGKYTLYVYPHHPNDTYSVPATMPITIKPAVNEIILSVPSLKYNKLPGKALDIKVTPKLLALYRNPVSGDMDQFKPANNKLDWEVTAGCDELQKAIKLKNGKITVNKNYIVSHDPEENKIVVKVTSKGPRKVEASMTLEITADPLEPVKMVLNNETEMMDVSDPEPKISTELTRKRIVIKDRNDEIISPANLTFSVSPKTGLELSDNGTINKITKTGTYTIKVTANDGSKKSISRKIAVKYDDLNAEKPYICEFARYSGGSVSVINKSSDNTEFEMLSSDIIGINVKPNSVKNALAENKCKVSLSNAKKIKAPNNYGEILFKAVKFPCSVTVTEKGGTFSKTYTFKCIEVPGRLNPSKKTFSCYNSEYSNNLLTFGLTGISEPSEGYHYSVRFDPADSAYATADKKTMTTKLANELSSRGCRIEWGSDTVVKLVASIKGCTKGNYSLYATLWDEETNTALTQPVKVNVKLTDGTAVKAALKPTVNISSTPGATAVLAFKTYKNVVSIEPSRIFNDNVKGEPNDFAKYFTLSATENKETMILKRTNEVIPEGMTRISGWINYTACNENDLEKTEKITVTFKDPGQHSEIKVYSTDKTGLYSAPEIVFKSGVNEGKTVKTKGEDIVFRVNTSASDDKIRVRYWTGKKSENVTLTKSEDGTYKIPVNDVTDAENSKSNVFIYITINSIT